MSERLLEGDSVLQIGFMTDNLERSAQWFSALTGKPVPDFMDTTGADEHIAQVEGQPTRVNCRIAMFEMGSLMVEFIEPGPGKNAWSALLEQKGPGVHHIAFKTRNMAQSRAGLAAQGHAPVQSGEFLDGGGRYAYFDTMRDLGAMIELLEFDEDREGKT